MRAAIYIRVSSVMQLDGFSLEAQERAGQDYAAARGWQVLEVYRDAGESARTDARPAFQAMLAAAARFDVLIVHKLDRFARNARDMLAYIDRLAAQGVQVVSVLDQIDTTNPNGRLQLTIMAGVAEWYSNNLATEIKKGKLERARQGHWNGTLSFGYTTPARLLARLGDLPAAYAALPESSAIPCPVDAPGVVLAYEMYAQAIYSHYQISEMLNAAGYRVTARRGGGLFSAGTVRDMLCNRFYLGETSYGGGRLRGRAAKANRQWMPGTHEAIITPELWAAAQDVLTARRQRWNSPSGPRQHVYPLAGIMRDGHNIAWGGTFAHGRRYYRQRAEQARRHGVNLPVRTAHAELLELEIEQFVTALQIPDDWRAMALNALQSPTRPAPVVDEGKQRAKLQRAQKLFLEGDIGESEYEQIRQDVHAALATAAPEPPQQFTDGQLAAAHELLQNLGSLWAAATLAEREKLARALFARVFVEPIATGHDGSWEIHIGRIMPTPVMSVLLTGVGVDTVGEDRKRATSRPRLIPFNARLLVVA